MRVFGEKNACDFSASTERKQTRFELSRKVFNKIQAISPRINLPMACKERHNFVHESCIMYHVMRQPVNNSLAGPSENLNSHLLFLYRLKTTTKT